MDQYLKQYYKLYTKAYCRAIKPNTNLVYSKYELVEVESKILVMLSHNRDYVDAISDSVIKLEYSKIMIDKIRSDLYLKRLIGNIKWEVQLIDKVVKVYKDNVVEL